MKPADLLKSPTWVIATHNKGKLAEFRQLLAPLGIEVVSAGELGLPDPEETGVTFAENALLKAHAAARESGLPALADDSGLCVKALGGAPGLYSARWCGPTKDPKVGMAKIKEELGDNPDQAAYFISVLALVPPEGEGWTVEGRCEGKLVWPPRGTQGHGYDPWFEPHEGQGRTFGELTMEEKQGMSHRGRSMQALLSLLEVV